MSRRGINWYKQGADEVRAAEAQVTPQPVAPPVQPVAPPVQVAPQPVAPPVQPVAPPVQVAPQPVAPPVQPVTPPVQVAPQPVAPPVQPVAPPTFSESAFPVPQSAPQYEPQAPPTPDPRIAVLEAQLAAERNANAEHAKRLEENRKAQAEARVQSLLSTIVAEDLDSLSKADVERVVAPIVREMDTRYQDAESRSAAAIDRLQQDIASYKVKSEQQRATEARQRANYEIEAAVPDWQQLKGSEEFRALWNTPVVKGSNITKGMLINDAYRSNNTAAVIEFFHEVRGAQPTHENVAQVIPVATVPAAPMATDSNELDSWEKIDQRRADLMEAKRRGMSRDVYVAEVAKLRDAEAAVSAKQ